MSTRNPSRPPSAETSRTPHDPAAMAATLDFELPEDDPVEAAVGLARLQRALFGTASRPPTLARYLLLERLSAGGMGVVYRAYDPHLDRHVAVKLVATDPDDPRTAERHLAEGHALAALSHHNVVRIFDVGTYDAATVDADPQARALMPVGGIFLVLELVEGQTLAEWVYSAQPHWSEIRDAYVQAGRGLMAAHTAGLVHHDFKPANAIRDHDGRVQVLDFGLARGQARQAPIDTSASTHPFASPESDAPPPPGTVTLAGPQTRAAGTPRYMAPEQHEGGPTGPATDQFALCAALYEALYGQPPFFGESQQSLGRHKRHEQIERPPGRRVPGWLNTAVLRGLRADPAARWPSMDALLRALEHDRGRRRRSVALGVGAVLAATTVGAIGVVRSRSGPTHVCDRPSRALVGVWDDEREARVRAAFEAVPRPYTAATWAAVDRTLDDYRDQWLGRVEALCEQTERPALADDLRPLAHACLRQRRRELEAVIEVLAEADAGVVDHARDTVSSLRSLGDCGDPTQLRMTEVWPDDPQRQAAVEDVYADLARAKALAVAGRSAESIALAKSLRPRADALDYGPLRVAVLYRWAYSQASAGDPSEGLQQMRDALAMAITANDHRSAAWAWISLVYDIVLWGDGYGAALELLPVAERTVERTDDDALLVSWLQNLGGVHLHGGDTERGLATMHRAEDLIEDLEPGPRLLLQENLALSHGYRENWAIAERRLLKVLEDSERYYGPGHPEQASILLNLSALALNQDHGQDALEYAQRALAIDRAIHGEHPQIIRALGAMAKAYFQLGDLARAREQAEAALIEADRDDPDRGAAGEQARSDALEILADLEEREGYWARAHRYHVRALANEERRHGHDHPHTLIRRLKLAQLDVRLGRRSSGLAARRQIQGRLAQRPPGLADYRWCMLLGELGTLHERLDEHEAAIVGLERALACAQEHQLPAAQIAHHRRALAQTLVDHDPARARALMRAALPDASLSDRPLVRAWLEEHAEP